MKVYLLYFFTSLLVSWETLVLFGVSAGFANMFPLAALIGCLMLFAIATPFVVYFKKEGLRIGLLALLIILPYSIGSATSIFDEGFFNKGSLFALLPIFLVSMSISLTMKMLFFSKELDVPLFTKRALKISLVTIPIVMTILYCAFYGKAWL